MDFEALFQSFTKIKVAVIGDVMLDTYWWGHVERISPEAPVPVVTLDKREYRIGGAGNVALNIASLGAEVAVFSAIGNDEDGVVLLDLLEKHNIQTSGILKSGSRITTNKARILSRNQQMIRLDSESTHDLDEQDDQALISNIKAYLDTYKPAVVIFEDYNKGVLTERTITAIIALCKERKVITAVDPKRKNFFSYQGVDIFKPNMKEVRDGLNLPVSDIDLPALQRIHALLAEKLQHAVSFVTLSEKGVFYCNDDKSAILPSHLRNIADVSGAGDTVIAVASLVYAATGDVTLMAQIANIAGGLVCEEVGTMAIDRQRLIKECALLLH